MKFRLVFLGRDEGKPEPALGDANLLSDGRPPMPEYERRGGSIIRWEPSSKRGSKPIRVTNFTARIARDLIWDDGDEPRRAFQIEAQVSACHLAFALSAVEFGRMGWVLDKLGPQAIIYPGQQQHARAAIQSLSGTVQQERIFTHLGWRQQGADRVYLHAAGALGGKGPLPGWQVQVPSALRPYQMRAPTDEIATAHAVRASLRFLSVASDAITLPLLAAVYRAPFGNVDFSLFLAGVSGVFKSALAGLCQQHFGAAMDGRRLPANFASTGNALEALAWCAKDVLLVVDDFAPRGGGGEEPLQRIAERLFRAAGNQQGRARLGGNGQLRVPKPPRALLLATGEQVPRGESIRARLLIVEVGPRSVDRARLSECQRLGQEGRFVEAMSAFIAWIACRYEELQSRLRERAQEIRQRAEVRGCHARLPSALAELQAGWELFLEFAVEVGAIGGAERRELESRAASALQALRTSQAKYQESSDPVGHYLALLRSALANGFAHVADRRGKAPAGAVAWGWQQQRSGRVGKARGSKIGWVNGDDLFLDPTASYQVAQAVAGPECLMVSAQTLRHRLGQRGLLVSTDGGRHMVLVRRTFEGCQRPVLHLKACSLVG